MLSLFRKEVIYSQHICLRWNLKYRLRPAIPVSESELS
jgi:hypothetical protein